MTGGKSLVKKAQSGSWNWNCSAPEIKHRLLDGFGAKAGTDYKVIGEPTDLAGARQLAISKSELAPELRRRSMFRR